MISFAFVMIWSFEMGRYYLEDHFTDLSGSQGINTNKCSYATAYSPSRLDIF